VKAQSLQVSVDQVFSALAGYLGSSYVNQFTKFGRTFQVFVQADSKFRLRLDDVRNLTVRNNAGSMIPLGTLIKITPVAGPSLISLYNLYPSATIVGIPARGYSSGQSMQLMEDIAKRTFPPRVESQWTAMSYQEKLVGNQMYLVFAMALLLVYLVLAGQYESWYRPLAVILAVPISLLGPVAALTILRIDNNLYTQIGIVLLIALSAKNAILIVEFARELRAEGKDLLESAVEAARARFRPILMTSFAFILGVLPLVLATGAGANARASIGITVFTGMLASTCLAVLFVPSFFVVMQRFEEWLTERKKRRAASVPVE
jgi:HAE1 family hydrophobic/amphiphilic exporter-1